MEKRMNERWGRGGTYVIAFHALYASRSRTTPMHPVFIAPHSSIASIGISIRPHDPRPLRARSRLMTAMNPLPSLQIPNGEFV